MYILKILVITVALFVTSTRCDQPSYQVSVYVKLHPKGPPIHVCNGAIIQSRFILTTATCIHHQFSPQSPIMPLPPSIIRVISGSSTEFIDELTLGVTDVLIAENFNYTSGDNDLALLRLNSVLPLDVRTDMSWITLDDAASFEGPCVANYYIRNSVPNAPSYTQSEELPLLGMDACRENNEFSKAREDDICSLYRLPVGSSCQDAETHLQYNGDRGTGLVCENKLVGLLSTVQTLDSTNEFDCSNKPIKAFYTNLAHHLGWIFDIIMEEDMKMYEEGKYISSPPYSGKNDAFEEPVKMPEPGSTSSLIGFNISSTTEPLNLNDAAAPPQTIAIILVMFCLCLQFFM